MSFKLNAPSKYESIGVVKLKDYPIAFENKVLELMEQGNITREEAVFLAESIEIELEIYYEKGYGLFAVECDAVECGKIISPYSGEVGKDEQEE